MGQYYKVVNLDRQEAFNGHDYGDGIKLMEFGMSGHGTMAAFAGHLVMDAQQTAPWAGHRIVIAGDYADEGRFVPKELADHNLYTVACGYHLENDSEDEEAVAKAQALLEKLPPEYRKAFEFVTPEASQTLLKGMGVSIDFGRRDTRTYKFLQDPSFVAEQPEDLFEAFEASPCEYLPLAVSDLQRCLRMSAHKSTVAWCNVESVELELDEETQTAKAMKVVFTNSRGAEYGPAVVKRRLAFPATQAAIVKFFDIQALTPKLEDKSPKRLA